MALEDENTRLKRLLANAMLDNVALKDWEENGDAAAEQKAVTHLMDAHGMSKKPSAAAT
jgi:hypothetical protein